MLVGLAESNGYIYIEANGGLNQQRTSVSLTPHLVERFFSCLSLCFAHCIRKIILVTTFLTSCCMVVVDAF